jgi:hypothetical protein
MSQRLFAAGKTMPVETRMAMVKKTATPGPEGREDYFDRARVL